MARTLGIASKWFRTNSSPERVMTSPPFAGRLKLLGQRVDDGDEDESDTGTVRPPLDPSVVAEIELVIKKLVRADGILARVAFSESTDPIARDKAITEFEKARAAVLEERWDRVIHHLRKAWNFVQECDDESDTGTRTRGTGSDSDSEDDSGSDT